MNSVIGVSLPWYPPPSPLPRRGDLILNKTIRYVGTPAVQSPTAGVSVTPALPLGRLVPRLPNYPKLLQSNEL